MAIARMTRVYIVGLSDHKEETMTFLQKSGVVHVEPISDITDEFERKNAAALQQSRKIKHVNSALKRYRQQEEKISVPVSDREIVSYVEKKLSQLEEIETRKQALQKIIGELSVWGNFNLQQINALEENEIYVQRFHVEEKKWDDFSVPEGAFLEIVSKKNGVSFFTITPDNPLQIPQASMLPWPETGLKDATREYDQLLKQKDELLKELAGAADKDSILQKQHEDALNEAAYTENTGTVYSENYIFVVQGWVPEEQTDAFLQGVEKNDLPLQVSVRDPLPEEDPPSLFKNNWLDRLSIYVLYVAVR